jgi:hypothetical protein
MTSDDGITPVEVVDEAFEWFLGSISNPASRWLRPLNV